MKALVLLLAAMAIMPVSAAGKPDTFAMLKGAKLTTVTKMEDLGTGAVIYRIEFCSDDCDRFEAADSKLAIFADYAYLFVVYSGHYDKYMPERSAVIKVAHDLPNPLVADAKEKGYAQAVLDSYRDQYHCPTGEGERKCVMHALFKAGGVRRYFVRYDEGEGYGPVDEDGK